MADGAKARRSSRARQPRQPAGARRESDERDAGIRLNEAFLKDVLSDWKAYGATAMSVTSSVLVTAHATARVPAPHAGRDQVVSSTSLCSSRVNLSVRPSPHQARTGERHAATSAGKGMRLNRSICRDARHWKKMASTKIGPSVRNATASESVPTVLARKSLAMPT